MKNTRTDGGFVARILLVIVALIALKYYFHFDTIEWIKSDQGQKIVGPAWTIIKNTYAVVDDFVRGLVSKS